MTLVVRDVSVVIGTTTILHPISLTIATGEVVALTGRSGSGKSTLLKVIAGLVAPTSGSVEIDGSDVTAMATHQRGVGLVFQDRVLFPHLNVAQNVEFGLLQVRPRPSRHDRLDRVDSLLRLVGLPGFAGRSVTNLSGGEAQRVALARALAPRPKVLLLDEPLGALDLETRSRLTTDLATLLRAEGTTALHVTHDPTEAARIADRVMHIPSAP
jgi:thiamine transport system ATP-binding protein